MTDDLDHFEAFYADKLWNLLPVVYRAEDTDKFDRNGPLRELVNRIGGQAAILRRSMDRLWDDQSIETCDDWGIAYIGDLLATNLVANLDARGRRLDVAKTIYYRRRKGTVAILEEIAADITGWDAKVAEFFRRLGRTRHGLDPAIGVPQSKNDDIGRLQRAEGLVGPLTHTLMGGTARLTYPYGAGKAQSAFDEFCHTADFRRGRGRVGWHNIPRLGVFLWRLKSYGTGPVTPVPVKDCDGWFTFDPTGRDVPLSARASRGKEAYGSNWVSPVEAQLPGPISQPLADANLNLPDTDKTIRLYPDSFSVLTSSILSSSFDLLSGDQVKVRPARGRFEFAGSPPFGSPPGDLWATYHYGFSSDIGAGPYDRRLLGKNPLAPDPILPKLTGGQPLTGSRAAPADGTLTLADSLTYPGADNVLVNEKLTIRAENKQRPLIRLDEPHPGMVTEWRFTGQVESCVVLDGLFVSGGDIVLSGDFHCVTITCCTLDPGNAAGLAQAGSPPGPFALAADGRELAPTRIWIEGTIGSLTVERSILGPIRARRGGKVETLSISDSILQSLPGSEGAVFASPLENSPPLGSPPESGSGDFALELDDGEVRLSRCTVLGSMKVHRLQIGRASCRERV